MTAFRKSIMNLDPPQGHNSPYIRLCLNRKIATYFPEKPSPLGKSSMSNSAASNRYSPYSASSGASSASSVAANRFLNNGSGTAHESDQNIPKVVEKFLFKLTLKLSGQEIVFTTLNDSLQEFIGKVIYYLHSSEQLQEQCQICYLEEESAINTTKMVDIMDPLYLACLLKKQPSISLVAA